MKYSLSPRNRCYNVYLAKRNDICAAIFPEDGLWYRGKIEKTTRDGSEMSTITFIDYGNRAQVHVTKLAALPAQFSTAKLGAQANEYQLALVKPPTDEVWIILFYVIYM